MVKRNDYNSYRRKAQKKSRGLRKFSAATFESYVEFFADKKSLRGCRLKIFPNKLFDGYEFVFRRAHFVFGHCRELTQARMFFDTFN